MGRASRGCVLWRWCVVWALKSDQGDLIGSGCKNQLLTTMTEREIRGRVVFGKLGFSKFLIFILNQHIEIASVEYFDSGRPPASINPVTILCWLGCCFYLAASLPLHSCMKYLLIFYDRGDGCPGVKRRREEEANNRDDDTTGIDTTPPSIRVVMLKKSRSSLSLCRCVPWKLALTTRGSDISSLGPQLWQFGIDKAASMIVVESQRVQPPRSRPPADPATNSMSTTVALSSSLSIITLLPAYVQICQKSRRIGCVIPRCKLQSGITQPIL